ncbi:MAG: 1,2-phenylacetyl-CoA epoxidase subunit PaaD [Terriglobales bacterium]
MVDAIRSWLAEVPDPELPVLSVVDLGMVREAVWHGDEVEVTITPTYSGCPVIPVIARDIEAALRGHGIHKVTVRQRLDPPWTSDWLSERGREKLREFGIAPPATTGLTGIAPRVACPHCRSVKTECVSAFGSTPCKALYRCRSCLEPFDYFKRLA